MTLSTNARARRSPQRRRSRVLVVALVLIAAGFLAQGNVGSTGAVWADSAQIGSNSFSTTSISAPLLVSATPGCSPSGKVRVILDWTAPSSGATPDGYDIYRSRTTNTAYSFVAHVTGGSTTTYTDGGVHNAVTYWYKVLSTRGSWTSAYSNELSALTPDICL